MSMVRRAASWLGGWVFASGIALAGLAALTYASGGALRRVPTCGGPDLNIYSAAVLAGALGLAGVLAYWALGQPTVRLRLSRLVLAAAAGGALVFAAYVTAGIFVVRCTGAPLAS